MANINKTKTPQQIQYDQLEKKHEIKRPLLKNCIRAFFIGGLICVIGQAVTYFYIYFFNFTEQTAGNPTVATMVFFAMLLTGFGMYDKLGQFSGAGSAVPVTGFGNAVISAAIEHQTEGYVLGVGGNIFKLAGSVIVFGVFSAFVVALIKTILIRYCKKFYEN
ncbi:stage V sporulation protein AC [Heyndrickxia sporothermodurans]|uniref:Stage V sporulation protein AC n=3 Tax=Heyndrickxia sporothermodurans TaxID=46224 RepID=A0AB37HDW7_9BACI|nr:stage V sporulation protein AC [Heyndrickxia sporothermodurans]MBL5766832.1 stage V sporulation protein AC [Heyndrickxia sporothermodurans]MBL5771398.1 stage V sporulation protein AC [Heyndrickxia sporothermodurans]MBL5774142.1 stage V sporulation protein AC [Heyndrickxia sporothermodurans]MBL5777559.1 stage V sporulation protein AC [Heyndrickxia sporothermodurans]MBL5781066.1 stage V sporulation protein AC [Heyndrickxia sporothermodurans]